MCFYQRAIVHESQVVANACLGYCVERSSLWAETQKNVDMTALAVRAPWVYRGLQTRLMIHKVYLSGAFDFYETTSPMIGMDNRASTGTTEMVKDKCSCYFKK